MNFACLFVVLGGGDEDDGSGWVVGRLVYNTETFPGLGRSSTTKYIPGFWLVVLLYFSKYSERFKIGNVEDEIALGFCFCTVGDSLLSFLFF